MIDKRIIENELIDLSRFASLATHIAANIDYDADGASRLVSMIDLLAGHIDGMEQRLMDQMFPRAAA